MKIACIYLRVSTDEQDIAHQADIKAKLKSGLIYPKYILRAIPAIKSLNTLNYIVIMTKTAQLYAKKVNLYQWVTRQREELIFLR
jgi:hypothetical protein